MTTMTEARTATDEEIAAVYNALDWLPNELPRSERRSATAAALEALGLRASGRIPAALRRQGIDPGPTPGPAPR